ncbi:MAG: hypothetical protein OEM59_10810 [Rhodospirillales bacterium]|nr:hypothetical protein [Rhodospirillales bacterium]
MLRLMLSLVTAAALWAVAAAPAAAQALCGERGQILDTLEQKYAETPRALGLSQDGGLLEVLVSPAGGWTILLTYPKRPTCVITTGQGWEGTLLQAGQPT